MKLSEAIREGAKLRPQAQGYYFTNLRIDGVDTSCSCAVGAAFEAVFGKDTPVSTLLDTDAELIDHYLSKRYDLDAMMTCPISNKQHDLLSTIVYLNDKENWTRERIADWLETQGW